MGYRVEEYSLNELNRIAVPGTVTPALFWVLPVGSWRPNELNRMWRYFVERDGICNDYGLLLVKDLSKQKTNDAEIDLAAVGATLQDVIPAGAERFLSPSARLVNPPRLLILSGGYPQPGWGILAEGFTDAQSFEKIVTVVNDVLATSSHLRDELRVILNGKGCFRRWRHHQEHSPRKRDIGTLVHEIREGEKANAALRDTKAALEKGEHSKAARCLREAVRVLQEAEGFSIPPEKLQNLSDNQKLLAAAVFILGVSADILADQLQPRLHDLITQPNKREEVFKALATGQLKDALRACLYLRDQNIVGDGEDIWKWATRTVDQEPARVVTELAEIISSVACGLQNRRGIKAQAEHDFSVAMETWRLEGKTIRETVHQFMEQATQAQWNLGPRFLVSFEDVCREQNLWVRSIPWDPARMVGWKIMVRDVRLDVSDLQIAAREFSPDTSFAILEDNQQSGVVDGSYFTDYVHYIAMSRPGSSPREITRDLVARLLRPAEMVQILGKHKADMPKDANSRSLADGLLSSFGWHETRVVRERSLASCMQTAADGQLKLSKSFSGNDVRIMLESFCKDIIDLVVASLGLQHEQIWDAIAERIPDYRASSRPNDWADEVAKLTLGSAAMLIRGLGTLAFPMRGEVNELSSRLDELSNVLNAASHHREGETLPLENLDDAAKLVQQVLELATRLIGELPWHLNVSVVYGEQPKVISGEAWSHGSATPRFLRVVLWTGEPVSHQIFFWNKNRRNPVISDPFFIVRPSSKLSLK